MINSVHETILPEVMRIMRKHLAAFASGRKLTPMQVAALNEIIARTEAARYEDVAAIVNEIKLSDALLTTGFGGISAQRLFRGTCIKNFHDKGLLSKRTIWPKDWLKKKISELAPELIQSHSDGEYSW